jgi:hypothetical protein
MRNSYLNCRVDKLVKSPISETGIMYVQSLPRYSIIRKSPNWHGTAL